MTKATPAPAPATRKVSNVTGGNSARKCLVRCGLSDGYISGDHPSLYRLLTQARIRAWPPAGPGQVLVRYMVSAAKRHKPQCFHISGAWCFTYQQRQQDKVGRLDTSCHCLVFGIKVSRPGNSLTERESSLPVGFSQVCILCPSEAALQA